MTIVTIPEDNDTWFSFSTVHNNKRLTITMLWDLAVDEIYSRMMQAIQREAANDPIKDTAGNFVRNYNILTYYTVDGAPVANNEQYATWYERNKDTLPASLSTLPDFALKNEVMRRAMYYTGIEKAIMLQDELRRWFFSISEGPNTITGIMEPGATYYAVDNSWQMKINCTVRQQLKRGDLQYATLEFV